MSKSKDLNSKVFAVWFYQEDRKVLKRFLLNFFTSFKMARNYVNQLKRFKIQGELLIGEVRLCDLISDLKGGKENA